MKVILAFAWLICAAPAATRFYLRDATAANPPTSGEKSTALPVGTGSGPLGEENNSLSTTKGVSQTSQGANGLSQTSDQDNYIARFTSPALAAQTISANTWTLAVATSEANASANSFTVCSIYVWRPSNSSVVGFVYDSHSALGSEWGGTEDGQVLTFSGSSVTVQENDVLVLEFWRHATQAMNGPYAQTLYFDGTTDVVDATTSDAASYLETPQGITFPTPATVVNSVILRGIIPFPSGSTPAQVPVLTLTCNPLTQWCISEDFALGGQDVGGAAGSWHFTIQSVGGCGIFSDAANEDYGAFPLKTGSTTNSQCTVYADVRTANYSSKTFDTYVRFKLSHTTSISFFVGMTDNSAVGESANDHIGVGYDTAASDSNFMCVTRSGGGSPTRTSIGVVADTSYHYARIRSTSVGTILCSIDGGSETTVSATIPSARIGPMLTTFTRTSDVRTGYVDYFYQVIDR